MTKEEIIKANEENGVLFVGETSKETIIWKRISQGGGWSYIADYGWPEHTPIIWDTTISDLEELELIINDIKNDKKGS